MKEYGGEQLVLPFDGDTRAYNYMQYVDFIKSLTRPGEITSNIDSYDDYYRQMNVNDETLFEIGRNVQFYDGFCRDEFNPEEYDYFIEHKLTDNSWKGKMAAEGLGLLIAMLLAA